MSGNLGDIMNDRELLDLAARAATSNGARIRTGEHWQREGSYEICLNGTWYNWNPLEDDGDALRLAIKLNIHVYRYETMTTARKCGCNLEFDERDDGDAYAATRRAIVRAAAAVELGKTM